MNMLRCIVPNFTVKPSTISLLRLPRKADDDGCHKITLIGNTRKAFKSYNTAEKSLLALSCQGKEDLKLNLNGKRRFRMNSVLTDMSDSKNAIIGLCQMNSTENIEENLKTCKYLIERAAAKGAKVVFLPEGFDYLMKNSSDSLAAAQPLNGPRMNEMCELAKSNNVWLSLGGFHCKHPSDSGKLFNSHVIVNNNGSIVSVYNKIHLFDVDIQGGPCLKESSVIAPGSDIVPPVSTPVGMLGLAICYDLRFPELSLRLAKQGADILTFPSAFTQLTGSAHWEVLLRSRAIETQCYVVAAAQTGVNCVGRRSYGHSMVVDPWGCVVAQCHDGTDVCIAQIDHKYLGKVRSDMPVWSHRRPDLYGSLNAEKDATCTASL